MSDPEFVEATHARGRDDLAPPLTAAQEERKKRVLSASPFAAHHARNPAEPMPDVGPLPEPPIIPGNAKPPAPKKEQRAIPVIEAELQKAQGSSDIVKTSLLLDELGAARAAERRAAAGKPAPAEQAQNTTMPPMTPPAAPAPGQQPTSTQTTTAGVTK